MDMTPERRTTYQCMPGQQRAPCTYVSSGLSRHALDRPIAPVEALAQLFVLETFKTAPGLSLPTDYLGSPPPCR